MKSNLILVVLVLAVTAGTAIAQTNDKATQAPAAQPATAQAQTATPGVKPPQPKTKEEYAAYGAAFNEPDLTKAVADADAFQKQYPDSEITFMLYQSLMRRFRNANNADKALEMGRKVLQLDPDNAEALITSAAILAETTHTSDLDRDQKCAEAIQYAEHGLNAVATKLRVPATATPEQVAAYKNGLSMWAYTSMGAINMTKEDWPAAEQSLRKAVQLSQDEPDPVVLYRLSLTLDKETKYSDALGFITQAEQAAGNSPFMAEIRQEKLRLQQLTSSQPPAAAPKQ